MQLKREVEKPRRFFFSKYLTEKWIVVGAECDELVSADWGGLLREVGVVEAECDELVSADWGGFLREVSVVGAECNELVSADWSGLLRGVGVVGAECDELVSADWGGLESGRALARRDCSFGRMMEERGLYKQYCQNAESLKEGKQKQ